MESVLIKVSNPSDINRCQALIALGKGGQCQYTQSPGSNFCPMHGGVSNKVEATKVRNYRLFQYQQRVNELADSEGVKSLREEIGILRMLMEETINQCQTTTDLLLYSSRISDMAQKIERLVVSCHRLESNLGFLMDRTTVLNISQNFVSLISEHIKDPKVIDLITSQMIDSIEAA